MLETFLFDSGLARGDERAAWIPLSGGVSSDIWRVDLPGRSYCVKRALPRLKVAADWQAPVSRNAYEWAWLQFASAHAPDHVPRLLAHDAEAGLFAMEYLAPDEHPVWKEQLMAGRVVPEHAGSVGGVLGLLHARSAGRADLAQAFDSGANFHALRLEPYLVATAVRHPQLAKPLLSLVRETAQAQIALVHGDVSPKNILIGPKGPVFLDAECAWFGDPAFDIAFCLNHLLLKGLVHPERAPALRQACEFMTEAYFAHVEWEPRDLLERRVARLLPGLLLARCDGKSPVEYLTEERDREFLRSVAVPLLLEPCLGIASVADVWFSRLEGHGLQPIP
jgi:tRNA A-37 threonylcarbamoyl transferase component Bud32